MSNQHLLYAIEAFLSSLSNSQYYEDLIVRGSYISRQWMGPYKRNVHDLDLLYLRDYEKQAISQIVERTINKANNELIKFDLSSLSIKEIWNLSLSPGVRVLAPYVYGDTAHTLQIDIAANDPLADHPVDTTVLTQSGDYIRVNSISIETAAAWKLHGLFEHLNGAWMTKTLWDLYVFCKTQAMDRNALKRAIELAFSSRLDPFVCLKRLLYGDFGRSRKSRKKWENEIVEYANGEYVELNGVIAFVSSYLSSVLELENNGELLKHSDLINYRISELRKINTKEAIQKLKTLNRKTRILPVKAYHSIPHLPDSRKGESDKNVDRNKARMLTEVRSRTSDIVIVQEKLDGSCVCAYRRNDRIIALGRAGDLASESPNIGRQMWAEWVEENEKRFLDILQPGERIVGEWLALVHGTRYKLTHEPFVAFDLFDEENNAISQDKLRQRCGTNDFIAAAILHQGDPISTTEIISKLGHGHHGAIDLSEGAVWRLERSGRPLFSAKFVRKEKVDGQFLPENTGKSAIWNWNSFDEQA